MSEPILESEVAWRPDPDTVADTHLGRFMDQHGIATVDALLARATEDVPWFTSAVLAHLGIRFERPYDRVLDLSRGVRWPAWCVGAEMNIVASCLAAPEDQVAVIWEDEREHTVHLTYGQLRAEVQRAANGLRALGVGPGDRVGIFMPMTPEIVVALLACAHVGAIALPLFSGYGPAAIASRLNDAEAVALFTADGCQRRGKSVALKPVADAAVAQVPSLRHQIVLRHLGLEITLEPGRDHDWHTWLAAHSAEATPAIVPAETPLMILYTSGTTGKPKGALHTHCGFPVKAAQDMALGMDVRGASSRLVGPSGGPADRIFWATDMGWMMGPWLVFGALILGATLMIYDGALDYPGPERIWRLIERHRLTHVGLSPTLVRALKPHGLAPVAGHDLSSLRAFASTGEPWNPEPWWWLFRDVGRSRVPILNYSGGTEISGGIVMNTLVQPIKPCAFAGPCPGIAADVVDEHGRPVRGQVGELVLRGPWIGMTRGFWRDPGRYEDAYWSRWPDTWVHGDFAYIDADGHWVLLGRSDDTLKIAGKRLGPAEVESILVAHPAVTEAAAIGVPDETKGEALVVFVVLRPGQILTTALSAQLAQQVADELGKPLRPKAVYEVAQIPKTRNAKVMRRLIRAAYLEQPLGDTSALENPESLDLIAHTRR